MPSGTCSIADIGAGDGQVALALARAGLRVVAVERTPGALARLRQRTAGSCETRLGDGLLALRPGEVEGCVIAGLGGPAIAAMLAAAPERVRTLRWLVLGPHDRSHRLESWLQRNGLHPRRARFVREKRRLYQIIVVEP